MKINFMGLTAIFDLLDNENILWDFLRESLLLLQLAQEEDFSTMKQPVKYRNLKTYKETYERIRALNV